MCGCLSYPTCKASLQPPGGPALGLKEGETWIGRGSFEASQRGQLTCSRRQARLELSNTGLRLECHGCNPLYFVVCHSRNFFATEASPATELLALRKGEDVELTDGDQFYFVALECLLTVVIKQNDTGRISRPISQLPSLQLATVMCKPDSVKLEPDLVQSCGVQPNVEELNHNGNCNVADEQQTCGVQQVNQSSVQKCGRTDAQNSLLKIEPLTGTSPTQEPVPALSTLPATCLKQIGDKVLRAPPDVSHKQVGDEVSAKDLEEGTFRDGQEGSDCRALDTIPKPLSEPHLSGENDFPCAGIILLPCEREAAAGPSSSPEVCKLVCEFPQAEAEEEVKDAMPTSSAQAQDNSLDVVESAKLFKGREGDRPLCNTLIDAQPTTTSVWDPQEGQGGGWRTSPSEACGLSDHIVQRGTEETTVMSHQENYSGPARAASHASELDCCPDLPNTLLPLHLGSPEKRDPLSDVRIENRILEQEEIFEEAGRTNDDQEHGIPESVTDDAWPAGPVEGMESVIASVSGYEGLDRNNLVKLINITGGAFTGDLSKANTHLVCWNFRSKKFARAMKLRKVVINHQWFEDCLRAGKRLSEEPYKLRSGEDVGPLQWKEVSTPLVTEQAGPSNRADNQNCNDDLGYLDVIDEEVQNIINEVLPEVPRSNPRSDIQGNSDRGKRRQSSSKKSVWIFPKDTAQDCRMKDPISVRSDATASGSSRRRAEQFHHRMSTVNNSGHGHDIRRRKLRKMTVSLNTHRNEPESGGLGRLPGNTSEGFRGAIDRADPLSRPERQPIDDLVVINLSEDADNVVPEFGTQNLLPENSKENSSQATHGADETIRGRNSQSSQSSQMDRDIACAICLVEAKSRTEGLLECGHSFCYKCIFTWTVQAVKGPSCPLCKATCDFITKQELSPSGELQETVVVVGKKEGSSSSRSSITFVLNAVCIQCGNSDSESLLERCGTCGNRACHTFCMDPPAPPPWFCPGCTHGHQRESMRLAWNQFLPGPSTEGNTVSNPEVRAETRPTSSGRRRNQPYSLRRPSRSTPMYRPSLHREVMQSIGPVRRRNIVGQNSIHTWLNQTLDGSS